jgi:aspartate aminotransferase
MKKKDIIFQSLKNIKGIKLSIPDGAFYLWLDMRECLGRIHKKSKQKLTNTKEISEILLSEHLLATVPGSEFGAEGYIRLSFVTSESNLEKAAQRFRDFSNQIFP